MLEHYFLFIIGGLWIAAATFEDLKKREVPNWLNFSLIAFALAYKAFYSISSGSWEFFLYGLLGTGIFIALAFAFYYGRVFAGGDAKLLMGIGALLPFASLGDIVIFGGAFLILLFLGGLLYTLFYSLFIVGKNGDCFWKDFKARVGKSGILFILAMAFSLVFLALNFSLRGWIYCLIMLIGFVLLYFYIKAVDSCMVKLVDANHLTEGDWLERSVRVRGKTIGKSVHGLSLKDINLLKKTRKKVWIKEGVPFVPAFLIAYVVMVYAVLVLGVDLQAMILSLAEFFS